MKIAEKITPQDWMTKPQARAVMDALGEGQALFVGGCVRNALLGEAVEDVDIATAHEPPEVERRMAAAGIKVVPTGIEHGTLTAVAEGQPFEITTLRRDVSTDGRRASVAFTQDWAEDAQRRDFTMNTLLADRAGHIYDPLGTGLADLRARRVVFVGSAAERIAEDHLRILRFFRFHGAYGQPVPDAAALAACRAAADKIADLSKERITQEFFKIVMGDNAAATLALMFENNVLKELSFVEYEENQFKALCYFQKNYDLAFLGARLLMLAGLLEKNIETLRNFLLIPKVFQKDMQAISEVLNLPALNDEQAVKVAVYKQGRMAAAQALLIEMAQDRVMNAFGPTALKIMQTWDIPDFPVTGEDLIKQGYKPGPELGKKLAELEAAWIEGGFKAP